jgi:hypothetical protein
MRSRSREEVRSDVRNGMREWLRLAHGFSVMAVVGYVLSAGASTRRFGSVLVLPVLVLIYYAGCLSAGAISGLLRPIRRTSVGAALAGVLMVLPLCIVTAALIVLPHSSWGARLLLGAAGSLVLGPVYGLIERHFDPPPAPGDL